MTNVLDRIAATLSDAREVRADEATTLRALAHLAGERGGVAGRRTDGAFFTADDVSEWLVRRAIAPHLLRAAGCTHASVAALLASNADLHAAINDRVRGDSAAGAAMRVRLTSLVVLDPTCGAGAFLIAAWRELRTLEQLLDAHAAAISSRVSPEQLTGLDCDISAVAACQAGLELVTGSVAIGIRHGDALTHDLAIGAAPNVIVGNPPYVRARPGDAPAGLASARAGNLAAWIVARALAAAAPEATAAFVLPVAAACSDQWSGFRAAWTTRCESVFASHFDTIPATLFPGVVQRLTMLEAQLAGPDSAATDTARATWYTTRYHRWTRAERPGLLDRIRFVPAPAVSLVPGSLAKIGSEIERRLLDRLAAYPPAHRLLDASALALPDRTIFYKRRWSYFLLVADFVPPVWNTDGSERAPTECKQLVVADGVDPRVLLAVYSSTTFWWYFSVFTDNRNVNRRELEAFPVPDFTAEQAAALAALGGELMVRLRACAEVRTCTYRSVGTIRNTYFRQGATRPVLDRIDVALAEAYGMADDELAFVLEFERRFRS